MSNRLHSVRGNYEQLTLKRFYMFTIAQQMYASHATPRQSIRKRRLCYCFDCTQTKERDSTRNSHTKSTRRLNGRCTNIRLMDAYCIWSRPKLITQISHLSTYISNEIKRFLYCYTMCLSLRRYACRIATPVQRTTYARNWLALIYFEIK